MDWYGILKVIRKEWPDKPFTARMLAAKADFGGRKSTPEQIASAWIGKLTRWLYLKHVGKQDSEEGRRESLYALTRWGGKYVRSGDKAKRKK